jgi:hypothetical protein
MGTKSLDRRKKVVALPAIQIIDRSTVNAWMIPRWPQRLKPRAA